MLLPSSHITIGKLQFDYVTEVEVDSSWKNLTDTAVIHLPRRLRLKEQSLKDVIKKGDQVKIELGYNGELNTEFEGYVTGIHPSIPFVIKCEDEMWKLKQTNITRSWSKVDLKELIAAIAPGVKTDIADAELGPYRINKASIAKVLEDLRKSYGLVSYFRDGVLVVGKVYAREDVTVNYHFQKNIVQGDSLEYRSKDDVKIKVKAISNLPNGTKIEKDLGDPDGEERTLNFYNLPEAALIERATEEMNRLKVDGYRGDIKAFGLPVAKHGYKAAIKDDEYPEKEGSYYIDRVVTTLGLSGFKRTIEIGRRAA